MRPYITLKLMHKTEKDFITKFPLAGNRELSKNSIFQEEINFLFKLIFIKFDTLAPTARSLFFRNLL